ncbi:MAG: TrkH family potassium uptake protein [Deltaproteobacteria bacterium]|nr:TrkH family potassium uptake protein [Deltaproteobacteria bacterium]
MNTRTVLWLVGVVLIAVAVAQLPSLVWAVVAGEPWLAFAVSSSLGAVLGVAATLPVRGHERALDHRAAFLGVTAAWLSACLLGSVPLLGAGLSPVDAFFESTSGFTTTGATLLSGLDALPRSLLLWRSVMQWLGGMGIVVLGIAVFPVLGVGGMQLFKADVPGPTKDRLTARIAETAKILWVLYASLTVVDAGLLYVGGMTPFDAACHALSTVSTGGFSTHDASFAGYDSPLILLSTTFFMLAGGTSFVVLHRALAGRLAWRDSPELRAYLGIFVVGAALIAWDLRTGLPGQFASWAEALQSSIFQTASILTTTGFSSHDFDLWPALSHGVLLGCMFIGGMAGSTAGGPKVFRALLLVRLSVAQFAGLVHPRSVDVIKLGQRTVDDDVILSVLGFVGLWLLAGTAVLTGLGSDLYSGFIASIVTLGNYGAGFGSVGPSQTYAGFAPAAKLTMSALMILGRLEIYAVLVLLTGPFWRR